MKNKVITVILFFAVFCLFISGCTPSNDNGNGSNITSSDTTSKTEITENDSTNADDPKETSVAESASNSAAEDLEKGNSDSSENKKAPSSEQSSAKKDETTTDNNPTHINSDSVGQTTPTEKTESGNGGGIVLPDDEW